MDHPAIGAGAPEGEVGDSESWPHAASVIEAKAPSGSRNCGRMAKLLLVFGSVCLGDVGHKGLDRSEDANRRVTLHSRPVAEFTV